MNREERKRGEQKRRRVWEEYRSEGEERMRRGEEWTEEEKSIV
jgi:hypothetical protein